MGKEGKIQGPVGGAMRMCGGKEGGRMINGCKSGRNCEWMRGVSEIWSSEER